MFCHVWHLFFLFHATQEPGGGCGEVIGFTADMWIPNDRLLFKVLFFYPFNTWDVTRDITITQAHWHSINPLSFTRSTPSKPLFYASESADLHWFRKHFNNVQRCFSLLQNLLIACTVDKKMSVPVLNG